MSLNENKKRIFEYVESRMTFIAPNLSIMVGASVAAKLMGQYMLSRTQSKQSGLSHQNCFFLFKLVLKKKQNLKNSTVKVSYFNSCLKQSVRLSLSLRGKNPVL